MEDKIMMFLREVMNLTHLSYNDLEEIFRECFNTDEYTSESIYNSLFWTRTMWGVFDKNGKLVSLHNFSPTEVKKGYEARVVHQTDLRRNWKEWFDGYPKYIDWR